MRVLVIEDETKVGSFIKRALEEESYAVDFCEDGAKGLEMALAINYDLLVVDVMLPSMSGLDVLKNIRRERIHTPVLILSAQSQIDQRVKGLDAGADDYLTKPFAIDELLARVRALLRRGASESPGILQVDDLILNPATRDVTSRGATHRFDAERVRITRISDAPYRPSAHPTHDLRTRVESRLRYLHQRHRCLCELPPE